MGTRLDQLAKALARQPGTTLGQVCRELGEMELSEYLDDELSENEPAWVISDLVDELLHDESGKRGTDRVELATVVLRALTSPTPNAVVWYSLADALRRVVARQVMRKVESERFIFDMLAPLKSAIDHHDAIGADRRTLAREQGRGAL